MTISTVTTIIVVISIIVILTEKIHRSIVATMGAVVMVAAGRALESPSMENLGKAGSLSVMEKHKLQDLPVVKDGKLVGIASRVDIGRAFLISLQTFQTDDQEAH